VDMRAYFLPRLGRSKDAYNRNFGRPLLALRRGIGEGWIQKGRHGLVVIDAIQAELERPGKRLSGLHVDRRGYWCASRRAIAMLGRASLLRWGARLSNEWGCWASNERDALGIYPLNRIIVDF
jgi:hypothetical protein